jgi:hypothetical protein
MKLNEAGVVCGFRENSYRISGIGGDCRRRRVEAICIPQTRIFSAMVLQRKSLEGANEFMLSPASSRNKLKRL